MRMLELNDAAGVIDQRKALKYFGDSKSLFYKKIKEIKEQMKLGRYNQYALLDDGKVRANYYVYYDYSTYRKMLLDKTTAKYVPEFNPKLIAEITPVSILHHTD